MQISRTRKDSGLFFDQAFRLAGVAVLVLLHLDDIPAIINKRQVRDSTIFEKCAYTRFDSSKNRNNIEIDDFFTKKSQNKLIITIF